jgi:hypothetical protein
MIVDFVWESRKWEEKLLIQRARVCFKQPSYDGGTSNLAVAMRKLLKGGDIVVMATV